MGALRLAPEVLKKLQASFKKYDLEAVNPKTGRFYEANDPDSPFLDSQGGAEQAYGMVMSDKYYHHNEDMSDFLNDVLGPAENYMTSGQMDDIIDSITNSFSSHNPPDERIQSLADNYASRFKIDEDEIEELIDTMRAEGIAPGTYEDSYDVAKEELFGQESMRLTEASLDALKHYRDNWLGYNAKNLFPDYTDYESILNNRPIIQK